MARRAASEAQECDLTGRLRQLLNVSADVLVTHEAPSAHYFGYGEIDELGRKIGVSKSFHGHQHDRLDYSRHWDRLGFQAYGVGF